METLGFEGVGVEFWGCLEGFVVSGDWIEPTIPSTGFLLVAWQDLCLGEGIEGSSHRMFQIGNIPSPYIGLD